MTALNFRSLALCASLGLAACSSAPTHYYTLMGNPPDSTVHAQSGAPAFQFEVLAVQIPVQVDQPQLVLRQSSGALAILETERWSAPLADEFHDALANQLELKLGSRDLAGLPKAPGLPVLSVQTDVRRFDSVPGNYVLIDVVWSLSQRSDGEKRRSLTCSTVIRKSAGPQLQDLVMAHQQAIAQLAGVIANTAQEWAHSPTQACP